MVEKKRSKNLLFVHSMLDEAGLDVYEFRVLCHISRRGSCFASLDTTAKLCKISIRKAQYTLKSLLSKGLILKTPRPGRTDVYKVAPNLWEKLNPAPKELELYEEQQPISDPWDEVEVDTHKNIEDVPFMQPISDPWDEVEVNTYRNIEDVPFMRPISLRTSERNLQDPWESEVNQPGIWLYRNRGLYL